MTTKKKRRPRSLDVARGAPGPTIVEPLRVAWVDAARGAAIAMMIAYHVCFDLTYYGWTTWPMLDDARWIAWRSTIVASFLFLVGVSLALRDRRERQRGAPDWLERGFVLRWMQVFGAATAVTAGSAILFPDSFIYFGVLHFVAVALWSCRRAPRLGAWSIALGLAVVALGVTVTSPIFDPKFVDWIGFAATKPITEDYVPLFPWLGVVLIGCGAGTLWIARDLPSMPDWPILRFLATTGRWSLTIYLVHQPLLLGAMGVTRYL